MQVVGPFQPGWDEIRMKSASQGVRGGDVRVKCGGTTARLGRVLSMLKPRA